jgi:acyl-CoA reductase-like NAD-dependent aldehyde dehydrogenase
MMSSTKAPAALTQWSYAGDRDQTRASWEKDGFPVVRAAGPDDVRRAVAAAHEAFAGWSVRPPSSRRDLMYAAAEVLEQRAERFTRYMARETGGTAEWAAANVWVAAGKIRHAASAALWLTGELFPSDVAGEWSMAVRQPVGVIATMVPWNAPLMLAARAVMVSLAAGNSVVLRASEDAPITSGLFIAEVLRDAGLPDGVLQVLLNTRDDAPQVVETLVADPRVRRVSFTGSTAVGRIIGQLAGKHLKPALLELGGKNPAIVCDDADLDHAASAIVYAKYMNSGQICLSFDRIIMHEAIAPGLTDRLVARVRTLACGQPEQPGTVVGPLVNERAAQRVAELVRDAVELGARALVGGGAADGRFYPPTVLDGVTNEMRIYEEETFGPVACLFTVADDDQAIALANDTDYGLTSAVFTSAGPRALRIARQLRHGSTHINSHTLKEDPQAPTGAMNDSGYGIYGARQEFEFVTQTRWLTAHETPVDVPSWANGAGV